MRKTDAAVVWEPGGSFELVALDLAPLRAGELRVRMVAVGMCHADLIARDQTYAVHLPAVLGHEGAGVVEDIGDDVVGFSVGDHVVLGFNYCGDCRMCREGFPGNCIFTASYNFGGLRPDGTSSFQSNGQKIASWFFGQSSFAERVNVPARLAIRVDADIPLPEIAPLGCSFMAGAGAVWNTLAPKPGTALAVFGVGGVGLAAVAAAQMMGCDPVIAVDVSERNLAMARHLGATHTVNAATSDPVASILRITSGEGVGAAVEASGVPAVFQQMTDSLGVRGHGVLVGAPAPGASIPLELNRHLGNGTRLSFVLEGDANPREFIPAAVAAIKAGRLNLAPMIDFFNFEEINLAVDRLERGEATKAVLLFPGQRPIAAVA